MRRSADEHPGHSRAKGMRQMSVPHKFFTIDGIRHRARTRTGAKNAGVTSAVKMAAVRIAVMRIRPCFLVISRRCESF